MSNSLEIKNVKDLLQSKSFARKIAESQQNAYFQSLGEEPKPLVAPENENQTEEKLVAEQKIAINIAGFYALECGVGYLAQRDSKAIHMLLADIVNEVVSPEDKELLCRFANATWKAGQPFRGLDRITRDVFIPFDLLPEDEKLKDWVQIQNAAKQVLREIDSGGKS